MEAEKVINIYNSTYMFKFEQTHNVEEFQKYMREHWQDTFVYSVVYLIVVFGTQFYMNSRKRLELRPYLAFWSGILALFSIIGSIRTVPELVYNLQKYGFEFSLCDSSYVQQGACTAVWTALFTLSKVLELGDTIFIVLRKQPLIFLHWYHHITVMIYCWFSYPQGIGPGRWYMVMNFVVHSFMYTYYCLRALQYMFPRWVNMFITSLQLIQMIVGIYVNIASYQVLNEGRACAQNYNNIQLAIMMYFSYFVLFAHFFYSTYIAKKPVDKTKKH